MNFFLEVVIIKKYIMNIKNLEFLGKGTQGSVYRIDDKKCIKIFKKKKSYEDELHSLLMAQIDPHFPKIYSFGDRYIIRECIDRIQLDKYLSLNVMTKELCNKILELYKAMKWVGYRRLDCAIFHIFLIQNGDIRLIDTAKAMKKDQVYPSILIDGLKKLDQKEIFLRYTAENDINLYKSWIKYFKEHK